MTMLVAFGKANTDYIIPVEDSFFEQNGIIKGADNEVSLAQLFQIIQDNPKNTMSIGGSAANTAVGWKMLGGDSSFFCALGDDREGSFYSHTFSDTGSLCISHVLPEKTSPICVCLIPPDNDVTYVISKDNLAALSATNINWNQMQNTDVVHVEGGLINTLTGPSVLDMIVSKKKNMEFLLSFVLPPHNLKDGLQLFKKHQYANSADFIFGNMKEYKSLFNVSSVDALTSLSADLGSMMIVTLGAEGAIAIDKGEVFKASSLSTEVVNTLGAGDNFAAGFLFSYVAKRQNTEESLRFATKVASLALTSQEAQIKLGFC